jgi:catechol 2,3-dioxygenase-like lactoylglutathione lyase family enzyme
MATIDHLILKINDLSASVDFYVNVMGFQLEGQPPCDEAYVLPVYV